MKGGGGSEDERERGWDVSEGEGGADVRVDGVISDAMGGTIASDVRVEGVMTNDAMGGTMISEETTATNAGDGDADI